jgi:hypothetical protein
MTVRDFSPHSLALTFLVFASVLPLAVPPAHAQGLFYDFRLEVADGVHEIPVLAQQTFTFSFQDLSRDGTTLVPGAPPLGPLPHHVSFGYAPGFSDHDGWQVVGGGGFDSFSGQSHQVSFNVLALANAQNPYYKLILNATVTTTDGGTFYREASMLFFTRGIPGFSVPIGSFVQGLRPLEIAPASLRVFNFGEFPRGFDFEVIDNPCDLRVAPPASRVVPPHTFQDVPFTVQGPDTRFDPLGAPYCVISVSVTAQDNPGLVRAQSVTVQLAPAVYFDPLAVFYVLVAILLLILLILFLRRRKERLEEEILGKPQKPWTIPVEQVYLRHLKKKDSRAWYVVRHYLMEDEYRSSLLWYKSYKKATRGDRRKEALVLRQEKAYERWKRSWERAISRPIRKVDRYEASLQRKLDRKARKAHRKQSHKVRKLTRQLRSLHAKKAKRAAGKHQKALAKARKKGRPDPEAPSLPEPDYPAEPVLAASPLSEHRWNRKADRYRRRMARKQGNLEVKFEKADARRLHKVRRKVQKLARKFNDPEFVAHHPLLQ